MRIIISPAKKMNEDTDSMDILGRPHFLGEARQLKSALLGLDPKALQALWRCNDAIAALNTERLWSLDLDKNLTPAILAYEGIQYQYMAPGIFEAGQLAYIQRHLRILSGFYGLIRPFDGVVPYRLEMQARLPVDGHADLYGFWGAKLAQRLCAETDFILNLASKEYSRAVSAHLPKDVRCLTCTFGEEKDGKVLQKGTQCKMARGRMVRWLAENSVTDPADIARFDELGYRYQPERSSSGVMVFLKAKRPARQAYSDII